MGRSVVTVSDLLNEPGLFLVLYCALIYPDSPGAIGSLLQPGVVHPQEAFTPFIRMLSDPVLINLNSYTIGPSSSLTVPKSCVVSSN